MSRARRPALIVCVVALACATAAVVGFSALSDAALTDAKKQEDACCWRKGTTPAWTEKLVGVGIPEGAQGRRAAYKEGSRYDTALLTFTLPEASARTYLARLVPENMRMIRNLHPEKADHRPTAPFGRFGLPEPETLTENLRRISLCPSEIRITPSDEKKAEDPPERRRLRRCVDLFTHEFARGKVRFYLRAHIG